MTLPVTCPSTDELNAFAVGNLPEPAFVRVADHVAQRFLHDAVGGQRGRRGKPGRVPFHPELDGQSRVPVPRHQVRDIRGARERRPCTALVAVVSRPEHPHGT